VSGREHYLPNFRSLATTLVLLLLGQLLAFMYTLAAVDSTARFWAELGLNSLFVLWVVLVSQTVLAIFTKLLDRMWAGLCVFVVVVMTCLLMTYVIHWVFGEVGELWLTRDHLLFQSMGNAVLAGMVVAVGLRYQYVQYLRRLQTKAEGAARLEALQARMKPHFLFNSLNAIASLTRCNPALAEELILDLAELFRAILRSDIQLTTLEKEIHLSRQYLNIEQQRLGERLRVTWDLDDDVFAALIPPLSLQPLLENAIYHGIEPAAQGGTLTIICQAHKINQVMLLVRNSLAEKVERVERAGNRQALENLRLRLQNFFGEEGKLTVSVDEGHYQVRIIIPYTTKRSYEYFAG
jgi:two-component system sensor histidine kinase AlgZ